MKNVLKKIYYCIEFETASALSVGSGENVVTDKDIIKDGNGKPYIPGSSLAGIYRALFDDATKHKYFGTILDKDGNSCRENSKLIVYDATMISKKYKINKRDCVGLDEYKTAIKGAKFDFEILEPGVCFKTYIEQDLEQSDEDIAEKIAYFWKDGEISVGSKTQRGLGQVDNVKIKRVEFDMTKNDEVKRWLEFDVYEKKCWDGKDYEVKCDKTNGIKDIVVLRLSLEQKSPISIRVYTTDIGETEYNPDNKQLTYVKRCTCNGKEVEKEVPVIPGTSWAGCFLHNIKELGCAETESFFGNAGVGAKKSKIFFSESIIDNAKEKIVSRNAIDRFSGGCVDGALFTEKMYYGGKTELIIKLPKPDIEKDYNFISKLVASIVDLHLGYMSLGGETSIGHGLFGVKKVNQVEVGNKNAKELYELLMEELGFKKTQEV